MVSKNPFSYDVQATDQAVRHFRELVGEPGVACSGETLSREQSEVPALEAILQRARQTCAEATGAASQLHQLADRVLGVRIETPPPGGVLAKSMQDAPMLDQIREEQGRLAAAVASVGEAAARLARL